MSTLPSASRYEAWRPNGLLTILVVMFLFVGMFFANFVTAVEPYDTIKSITTFEFMTNKDFFESNKFILMKKEEIAPNLEMLWYELNLN